MTTSKKVHIVTIQIVVTNCEDTAQASDYVSETLRPLAPEGDDAVGVLDWSYLKVGGQFLTAVETYVPVPYEEGWLFDL